MADLDRGQVYAAELAAFDGTDLEHVVPFEVVERRLRAVIGGAWWPGGDVSVRPSRSTAHSSVTRCALDAGSVAEISIAGPQSTVATAAHELAHALAGVTHGHDARFRRAHVDVVQVMTNLDRLAGRGMLHVDQLRCAYEAAGLEVGERSWVAPPEVGGAIAL